jgi:acetoin utilization deacetylase AcuC-like enzyme
VRTWFWPEHGRHDPSLLPAAPGSDPRHHAESAERGDLLLSALREAGLGPIEAATAPEIATDLALAHRPALIAFLATAYGRWAEEHAPSDGGLAVAIPETFANGVERLRSDSVSAELGWYCTDTSSPLFAGTHAAAIGAASCAVSAADDLLEGAAASYALCRPPGHHASSGRYGGFCYFNNAAVAARRLSVRGRRAAVLDIDVHHGSGTQDIFWNDPTVFFASLHMDPAVEYPYHSGFEDELGGPDAEGTNLNIVLPTGCDEDRYLLGLEIALAQIGHFGADALVVSLGVDTHRDDPLGRFELTTSSYRRIGEQIAQADLPTMFVQEGGYDLASLGASVVGVLGAVAAG